MKTHKRKFTVQRFSPSQEESYTAKKNEKNYVQTANTSRYVHTHTPLHTLQGLYLYMHSLSQSTLMAFTLSCQKAPPRPDGSGAVTGCSVDAPSDTLDACPQT